MNKCLVTKLSGVVDNPDLLRLGEIRIKVRKLNTEYEHRALTLSFSKETNITITGDGYFTDKNSVSNKGKQIVVPANTQTIVYISNGDYDINIYNKYDLTFFVDYAFGEVNAPQKSGFSINIEDFKYSRNITRINTSEINGDIAAVKNLTNLTSLSLSSTQVSGDIAAVKNLTNLTLLSLSSTQVSGDIAAVKNLTNLTSLSLFSTQVSGDIAAVKNLTNLTSLSMRLSNITGDISNLSSLTKLASAQLNSVSGNILALNSTKLTNLIISNSGGLNGDLALLKKDFTYLGLENDKTSVFSWTSRATDANIYGIGGNSIMSSNLDDVLNNLANCKNAITSTTASWAKVISFTGTRTSASDAAVEKLTGYGYTISIAKV